MGRKRALTLEETRQKVALYRTLNPDLSEDVVNTMAAFFVAGKTTADVLTKLLGRDIGQTFWRDRAFYWWNAFALSGLAEHWGWFVERRNAGERLYRPLKTLRERCSPEEWRLFSHRLGAESLDIWRYGRGTTVNIWTKGGTWWRSSPFTQLLVLHEHLPPRPFWRPFHYKLGHDGIRRIESELMALIDPDSELAPEARVRACDYTRYRVAELLGRKDRMAAEGVAWFFQCKVPYEGKYYRPNMYYPANKMMKGSMKQWTW